jgi:hypothetical protein
MAGTYVYIDGYNLYYRALKGTGYKWLDLEGFADAIAGHGVTRVRHFTAAVKSQPGDGGARQRQTVYWRALKTLPRVRKHEGTFQVQAKWRPPRRPILGIRPDCERFRIRHTEEKGSDVNLASWLLLDGFQGKYDKAIVVSNDSDLVEPVRMVVHELGLPVAVLNPSGSRRDQITGSERIILDPIAHLAACQLPARMQDAAGTFHKPPNW